MKKLLNYFFIGLCLIVGLYPSTYIFIDSSQGLLGNKADEILDHFIYMPAFYMHIFPGGIALLTGWVQFMDSIRNNKPVFHRNIGKVYIVSVIISSVAGIGIAFAATGGIIASAGFISLGLIWLLSTIMGFINIKNHKIIAHRKMMILSYSMCFAAVTLRLWLPILNSFIHDFIFAYTIVSWLCWVPNLIFSIFLISKIKSPQL